MNDRRELIPPPTLVREELARALRRTDYLRALLRLSLRVAKDAHPAVALDARQAEGGSR